MCWLSLVAVNGDYFIVVHGLLVVERGLPIAVASLVVEHRVLEHRLSSCGSRAQ